LIPAKDVLLASVAKVTGLNVEKDIYLPWAERVTVHGSAEEFLHQAVKSRQHDFAVLYGINHPNDLIGGTYGKLNASNGLGEFWHSVLSTYDSCDTIRAWPSSL